MVVLAVERAVEETPAKPGVGEVGDHEGCEADVLVSKGGGRRAGELELVGFEGVDLGFFFVVAVFGAGDFADERGEVFRPGVCLVSLGS